MPPPAASRASVVHASTLSLIQERSRSVSLGLPPSASTHKQIERNIRTLVEAAKENQTDLEEKNELAKAGRIGLEEVRIAEDTVTEAKSNLQSLLDLLGTDEWATRIRTETNESCPLLAPAPLQSRDSGEESTTNGADSYRAPQADRTHYHDDVEDDNEANERLLSSQKQQIDSQDDQLDRLGLSISRQHHLSLQMNEELEEQSELLGELESGVDNTALRLGRASNQLERVRRVTKEHASSCTIIGLIVLLILLIALFK